MQVGDLVVINAIPGHPTGVVMEFDASCGWLWVMIQDGRMVVYPETCMEIVG